jgi:hypothetical protein
LTGITASVARAEATLAACRQADDVALGEWIVDRGAASGRPRPQPSAATISAETNLSQLLSEGRAARAALPAKEQALIAAGERTRAAQRERDDALWQVAAEAGLRFVETVFRQRIAEVMQAEAVVAGLIHALMAAAPKNDGSPDDIRPLAAAAQITEALQREQQSGQAIADIERGRRLLMRLSTDAAAVL